MLARHWRGWTEPQDADAHPSLPKENLFPRRKEIDGYIKVDVLFATPDCRRLSS